MFWLRCKIVDTHICINLITTDDWSKITNKFCSKKERKKERKKRKNIRLFQSTGKSDKDPKSLQVCQIQSWKAVVWASTKRTTRTLKSAFCTSTASRVNKWNTFAGSLLTPSGVNRPCFAASTSNSISCTTPVLHYLPATHHLPIPARQIFLSQPWSYLSNAINKSAAKSKF